MKLGRLYEEANVPEGARQAFTAAAQLAPQDPKITYRADIAHGRASDLESALAAIQSTLELAPEYGPAWRRMGNWLLDLGRAEEASDAFSKAQKQLPDRPDAHLGLARAALLQDKLEEALRFAFNAHNLAPEDRYVRLILGTALRRSGRQEEARPHLEAGAGAKPSYVDPWSESTNRARQGDSELAAAAQADVDARRWPGAIEKLEQLLSERPNDVKVMFQLGVSLMGASRFDDAIAHYDRSLGLFPARYDLMAARAAALRSAGRTAESLAYVDEVIARWPDRASAYLQRGATLELLRDVEGARAAYSRATALKPGDLRGRLFEGRLLAKSARYGEASDVLEEGLRKSSASPPLIYFKLLLQCQQAAQASPAAIEATLKAGRAIHGDSALSSPKKR